MKRRYPSGRHGDGVPYDEFDARWAIEANGFPLSLVVIPVSILWGMAAFLTDRDAILRGLPLMLVGVTYMVFGLRDLRGGAWREHGWWEGRSRATWVVAGPWLSQRRPASRGVFTIVVGSVVAALGLAIVYGVV
jgi:hypothetical protein